MFMQSIAVALTKLATVMATIALRASSLIMLKKFSAVVVVSKRSLKA
jgi:hypothetical protein